MKKYIDGYVESLKRFTKDVREVKQSFECGDWRGRI